MNKADISELCERRFLRLIEDYGLPDPDQITVNDEAIEFVWNDQKLMVRIELADFMDRDARAAYTRDNLAA